MSLAHAVLMPGFPGTSVPGWIEDAIGSGLAGVALFAENVPDLATARALTDALRDLRPDLVISADEEGGDVTRLESRTGSSIPGNAALGVVDDPAVTFAVAQAYGRLISLAGVDLALGPSLDVASEPLNPIIGVRSFGSNPAKVAIHGRAFVAGLAAAGVASCGKHFPGHGATTQDSHVDLPVIAVPLETLRSRDEQPFADAGPDAVMTAHVVVPDAGDEPASLSAWAYRHLRDLGFDGPILTDALGMRAVTDRMDIGEACVKALAAGADLLLLDAPHMRDAEADFAAAVAAIDRALEQGRLEERALRASAARNATLTRRHPAFAGERAATVLADLRAAGTRVAEQAIRTRGDVVLRSEPVVVDVRRRVNHASGSRHNPLGAALAAAGIPADSVAADAELPPGRVPVVLTRQPLSDPEEAAALDLVLRRHPDAIVVHGGVEAAAPEAERLVCMHGIGAVNAAAAVRAMRGADL